MNSGNTPNRRDEDEQLQKDFADISALHQLSATQSPAISKDLDHSVLRQARLHHTETINASWILSPAILLALGTLLLFAIGIFSAVSLDHVADQQTEQTPIPNPSMIILFVHGMGRSKLSGWNLLRLLRSAGLRTTTFSYATARESFAAIQARLETRITTIASTERYTVIGHSLGGVLLRAALNALPAEARRPRHVFLLGSPISTTRLAVKLKEYPVFRLLTGDCGQLLASTERMAAVGALSDPLTSVVGVTGIRLTRSYFEDEPNDGVVAESEVSAHWISSKIRLPIVHTLLPASSQVADIIIDTLSAEADDNREV
jgi:pimeloyl-ACP methyl ester carboxylesterase